MKKINTNKLFAILSLSLFFIQLNTAYAVKKGKGKGKQNKNENQVKTKDIKEMSQSERETKSQYAQDLQQKMYKKFNQQNFPSLRL